MMEKYFAFKYYEEIAGYICLIIMSAIVIVPIIIIKIQNWWNNR